MTEWQNKDGIEERCPTAAVKKTQAVSGVTRQLMYDVLGGNRRGRERVNQPLICSR
jgi:hypothetical protein